MLCHCSEPPLTLFQLLVIFSLSLVCLISIHPLVLSLNRMSSRNFFQALQFSSVQFSRSVVSDSMRPHRRQPTRLLHPWDSPGKNTGVGCHFLPFSKACTHAKSLQSCPTLCHPIDGSPPGPPPSPVPGILTGV